MANPAAVALMPFCCTTYIYVCHHKVGDSALMWAANRGDTEVVVELVNAEAGLNLQNKVYICCQYCVHIYST